MTQASMSSPSGAPALPDASARDATPPPAERGGTIFSALNALLRHRLLVASCALTLAIAAGAWPFTRERTYTSVSSFTAEGRQTSVGGLAAQLGLALPGGDNRDSPQFYVELLQSREILGAAVETKFSVPSISRTPATLVDIYGIKGADSAVRRDDAMARLSKAMDLSISARTNVVSVKVSASSPGLAQQLNRRLLDLLGDFNIRRRQSRASEERRFAEGRLASVKGELRVAEDRLQYFLQSNRDYRNSPSLQFSYERLQADVQLLRELVTTLQQSAEQAKIDEVRDTPTITMVESPDVPVRPDPRGAVKYSLIGFVLGTFLGMGIAFVRETMSRPHVRASTDYEEFVQLRREAVDDLFHPWRALRRSRRRRSS
jgi:uncharacterized protein involved in exopolysaccharide biosynthesis